MRGNDANRQTDRRETKRAARRQKHERMEKVSGVNSLVMDTRNFRSDRLPLEKVHRKDTHFRCVQMSQQVKMSFIVSY